MIGRYPSVNDRKITDLHILRNDLEDELDHHRVESKKIRKQIKVIDAELKQRRRFAKWEDDARKRQGVNQ